ncbi:MAG: hypothetical protein JOZ47_08900 [Kutzneria sp.]|nr:hypothetical protein [Kutzneria sp.]MBV9845173.1 hypothetical protein [Kutzneria sp.]
MRIGVRLDATRAHGVLVHAGRVLASSSISKSAPFDRQLTGLLRQFTDPFTQRGTVDSVTWDISAVLEGSLRRAGHKHDSTAPVAGPVGVLRLLPRSPYAVGHTSALVNSLVAHVGTARGGHDLFGTELAPIDLESAARETAKARATGVTALAVIATGASGQAAHEQLVAARLLGEYPDLRLCLSHEVGGLGLLERETTTVVNAALFDLAEELVTRLEGVTKALGGATSCWFASGDGGRVTPRRLRTLPVLGLSTTPAAALLGAAILSARTDTTVLLTDENTISIGHVRDGLPHVESDLRGTLGVRLSTPQPALTVRPARAAAETAALLTEQNPANAGVVVPVTPEGANLADWLTSDPHSGLSAVGFDVDPSTVGTACAEPSAWLDLVVTAGTQDDLHRQQSLLEQRALTLVEAGGARPGSGRVIRSAATSLGFLRGDVYRLRVRASAGTRP